MKKIAVAVLSAVLTISGTAAVQAHMPGQPHSMLENNSGYVQADPALFGAMVMLGGGPARFHGITFRQALERTHARDEALRQSLGFDKLNRFDRVLTMVVNDRLRFLRQQHAVMVPVPARLRDPQGFANAVFAAGSKHGAFSVEEAYNRLFSTEGHEQIMDLLARRFTPLDDQAFHQVMQRLVFTAKSH